MKTKLHVRILSIVSGLLATIFFVSCHDSTFSDTEKESIKMEIRASIDEGIEATRTKNIDLYMKQLPEDLLIYDESGEIITREQQRAYALRDWSIIDKTLDITISIDSINYIARDSILVYTSQYWKRMMFQRDGITLDTVVTTQKHKEIWKKTAEGWFNYVVEELGGQIFINGKPYQP